MALPSTPPPPPPWNYDVFVSFREEDIDKEFIRHLYDAFCAIERKAFVDEEELRRGGRDEISPALLEIIEGCEISVVIFSRNYAYSKCCLDELIVIMRTCQMVVPVFYHVDPSYVRNQTGSFGDAFVKLGDQLKFKPEYEVDNWRAVTEVSYLSGCSTIDVSSERQLADLIVEVISIRLETFSLFEQNKALQKFSGNYHELYFYNAGATLASFFDNACKRPVTVQSSVAKSTLHSVLGHPFLYYETEKFKVQVPGFIATLGRNVQKIFRYFNDDSTSTIGVHGIGGIGKTTALKTLISCSEIRSSFDMVISVTVSRRWNTRKIQNKVLRQLSLHREDHEKDHEVAKRILHVLKGKKFLLVLDDVWENIDLIGIGIPSAENGCKILLASRILDVCHMNASHVIEMETLSFEEAWLLFYIQAGKIILGGKFKDAVGVVKGCHGLPLLIIITGKSLVNPDCWHRVCKHFTEHNRVYQTEDVIQLLKVSFELLKPDVKGCILYCALFPEEVTVSGLIEYGIEEGIIGGTQAHKWAYHMIDDLVRAQLVQVSKDDATIKMHGLVRDCALRIISSAAEDGTRNSLGEGEGSQFLLGAYSKLVKKLSSLPSRKWSSESHSQRSLLDPEAHQLLVGAHAGLREPPLEEEWKSAKMVFLMDNELHTLPKRPSCSNLLRLFLQRNHQLREIPPSFFELMTSLKVLNLSKTSIKFLPKTLFNLKCLEVLILRDCKLLFVLPSEVGSLECLEVFDLQGTEINKLPDEMDNLTSLRCLNVCFYGSIDKSENIKLPCNLISRGTLSKLQELETLSISVHPGDKRWENDLKYVITEVSKLIKLTSLCLYFPEMEFLDKFLKESTAWTCDQSTEFKFVVGHDVETIVSRVPDDAQLDYNQQKRCLRFVNGRSVSTEFLKLLHGSTALCVDHHLDFDSLSRFGVENMQWLKFCIITECLKITTVVDVREYTLPPLVLPRLENLTLNYLWNLRCLWEGIVRKGSFGELRILTVHACQNLEYVFTTSMIQFLYNLKVLIVEDCSAITSIVLDGEIIDSSCNLFPSLKELRLHSLPELINVWSNDWPELEYISFNGCPKLKKIGLDSKMKDALRLIEAEEKWWAGLDWKDSEVPIHLEDCLYLFSEESEDQEFSFSIDTDYQEPSFSEDAEDQE